MKTVRTFALIALMAAAQLRAEFLQMDLSIFGMD
jgi:hypothetical protein